jgi:hypothetical protein
VGFAALALFVLLLFSDQWMSTSTRSQQSHLGRVLSVKGLTLARPIDQESFTRIAAKQKINGPLKIVTGFDGEVTLDFGETFTLLSNSSALLSKKGLNFIVTLESGEIKRQKPAENVQFLVGQKLQTGWQIKAPKRGPQLSTANLAQEEYASPTVELDLNLQKRIQETMKLHRRFLEKCFIKFFEKENKIYESGTITSRFTLSRQGRLKDVSITNSDFDDEALKACVQEVLSRVRFKNYRGEDKTVLFPITIQ